MISQVALSLLGLSVLLLAFSAYILVPSSYRTWELERHSLLYGLLTLSCTVILALVAWWWPLYLRSDAFGAMRFSKTCWGGGIVSYSTENGQSVERCLTSPTTSTSSIPKDSK